MDDDVVITMTSSKFPPQNGKPLSDCITQQNFMVNKVEEIIKCYFYIFAYRVITAQVWTNLEDIR